MAVRKSRRVRRRSCAVPGTSEFEGRSEQGCPQARWVLRRSAQGERFGVVYKTRPGHYCPAACIVIAILQYEAIDPDLSARAYATITAMTNAGLV